MKKVLVILGSVLVVFLTACGNSESPAADYDVYEPEYVGIDELRMLADWEEFFTTSFFGFFGEDGSEDWTGFQGSKVYSHPTLSGVSLWFPFFHEADDYINQLTVPTNMFVNRDVTTLEELRLLFGDSLDGAHHMEHSEFGAWQARIELNDDFHALISLTDETGTDIQSIMIWRNVNLEPVRDLSDFIDHPILGEWQNVGIMCCYAVSSSMDGGYNGVGLVTRFYPDGTFTRFVVEGHWRFLESQANSNGEYIIDTGEWSYVDGIFNMANHASTMSVGPAVLEFEEFDVLRIAELENVAISRAYFRVGEAGPFIDLTHTHGILGRWYHLDGDNLFERSFYTGGGIIGVNLEIVDWLTWEIEHSALIRMVVNDVTYFITSPDFFDTEIVLHDENMQVINHYRSYRSSQINP